MSRVKIILIQNSFRTNQRTRGLKIPLITLIKYYVYFIPLCFKLFLYVHILVHPRKQSKIVFISFESIFWNRIAMQPYMISLLSIVYRSHHEEEQDFNVHAMLFSYQSAETESSWKSQRICNEFTYMEKTNPKRLLMKTLLRWHAKYMLTLYLIMRSKHYSHREWIPACFNSQLFNHTLNVKKNRIWHLDEDKNPVNVRERNENTVDMFSSWLVILLLLYI